MKLFKKIFKITVYILLIVIFCSCETPSGKQDKKDGYSIIEIDNCEYIEVSYWLEGSNALFLTHKGNCKFCIQRNKK
jgi:hypothetical protein